MPLRNLKAPAVTTLSPSLRPSVTDTKSPTARPVRMNRCSTINSPSTPSSDFFILNHKHRIAVRGAQLGSERNAQNLILTAIENLNPSKHAWPKDAIGIFEGSLQADIAGDPINLGVDGCQLTLKDAPGIGIGADKEFLASGECGDKLLGQEEVDKNGI